MFWSDEAVEKCDLKAIGFNPCKGFRCFEAAIYAFDTHDSILVSIPVRVLDVLKRDSYGL